MGRKDGSKVSAEAMATTDGDVHAIDGDKSLRGSESVQSLRTLRARVVSRRRKQKSVFSGSKSLLAVENGVRHVRSGEDEVTDPLRSGRVQVCR
ncbi:hypothetical protein N7539_003962 [Penicillium diatomitis]|uniref:Uncharacterized protein n=1 Tax=Penicillium diatomitis TaxID=2819901 RepID=A0A9X0BYC8_9EURO|nr:uncharacterized protein N7539_003962 [Penicillium diatomitis]KAJ5489072.1 hypothetical protein N7539_003962 [Penicillium diatomitis]